MIQPPNGWRCSHVRDSVLLTHPRGLEVAGVRYDERLRPIARVSDLVDSEAAPLGFVRARTSPIERLVTDEGEHAARVTLEGTLDDAPAELSFGFVFLDDFYSRLRAITFESAAFPEVRATVTALVRHDMHLVGRVRRRRYFYAVPPGWHGSGGLFEARWHPPDYPTNPATLLVSPAVPHVPGFGESVLSSIVGGTGEAVTQALVRPTLRVHTSAGLVGERWHLQVGDRHVYLVILQDDAFHYTVRLDARPHDVAAEQVFVTLVESIEPVPRSQEGRALETAVASATLFWTE